MHIPYLSDPGHGWLIVPRSLVLSLGIADKISRFSYQSAPDPVMPRASAVASISMVYLEEDCDAGVFLRAMEKEGRRVALDPINVSTDSFIRRLPGFTP